MLGQIFLANARLAIEAVQRCLRGNADQVAVALFVFRQHQQVVVLIALRIGAMIFFLADVEFAAQNGLYPVLLRRIKKWTAP